MVEVSTHGDVDEAAVDYARSRVDAALEHVRERVLLVRLRLGREPDPANTAPVSARVTVDIDGAVVRAHASGRDFRETADVLERRLLDQLGHRATRRRALRRGRTA
jgi:hypothetical protein